MERHDIPKRKVSKDSDSILTGFAAKYKGRNCGFFRNILPYTEKSPGGCTKWHSAGGVAYRRPCRRMMRIRMGSTHWK